MTKKNPAAVSLGRLGGLARSDAKAAAVRANGKKGGRPTADRCGRDKWSRCIACDGRLHLPECTTRRNPEKDCCAARHRRLHDNGQLVGLGDSSLPMYDPDRPTWA